MTRALVILWSLDVLAYSLAALGDCRRGETLSGAAYRTEQKGRILGRFFRPKIDWRFARLGDLDHCRASHENECRTAAGARRTTKSQSLTGMALRSLTRARKYGWTV